MHVVVCVKQVMQLGDEIQFTGDALDVDPEYLDAALNDWDGAAVEAALQMRERLTGEVVVVTCGSKQSESVLRRYLAMGADRAIRIDHRAQDPFSIARSLADVVRAESADLILCGVQSSDSAQSATGTVLAELLDLPRATVVTHIEYDPVSRRAVVERELEGGLVDRVEIDTPAVLTIQTGINQPRYVNLRAIKRAEQAQIERHSPATGGSPAYRVRRVYVPEREGRAKMIEGSPAEIAERIAAIVAEHRP